MPEASFVPACKLLGDGDYYVEERTFFDVSLPLPLEEPTLLKNLQVMHGVGPVTEGKLREEGYEDVESLAQHIRWGDQARSIAKAVERKDARFFFRTKAPDWQVLGLCAPEEMVFLDIETCGLTSTQPLFLVGMMKQQSKGVMILRQFFARSYEEEVAVLDAVKSELESAAVIVTYNGLRFDMPYIQDRMAYYGTCCLRDHFHFDLLWTARRLFRETLPNCKLVTVASHVLGYERDGDIPGYMIPEVYHEFVMNPCSALIRPILEHNAMDIHAMALLVARILLCGILQ
jgi:uncharacterized protein YprB with RNaseH-like and TPR domain